MFYLLVLFILASLFSVTRGSDHCTVQGGTVPEYSNIFISDDVTLLDDQRVEIKIGMTYKVGSALCLSISPLDKTSYSCQTLSSMSIDSGTAVIPNLDTGAFDYKEGKLLHNSLWEEDRSGTRGECEFVWFKIVLELEDLLDLFPFEIHERETVILATMKACFVTMSNNIEPGTDLINSQCSSIQSLIKFNATCGEEGSLAVTKAINCDVELCKPGCKTQTIYPNGYGVYGSGIIPFHDDVINMIPTTIENFTTSSGKFAFNAYYQGDELGRNGAKGSFKEWHYISNPPLAGYDVSFINDYHLHCSVWHSVNEEPSRLYLVENLSDLKNPYLFRHETMFFVVLNYPHYKDDNWRFDGECGHMGSMELKSCDENMKNCESAIPAGGRGWNVVDVSGNEQYRLDIGDQIPKDTLFRINQVTIGDLFKIESGRRYVFTYCVNVVPKHSRRGDDSGKKSITSVFIGDVEGSNVLLTVLTVVGASLMVMILLAGVIVGGIGIFCCVRKRWRKTEQYDEIEDSTGLEEYKV